MTHGPIPASDEEEKVKNLEVDFPLSRYMYGGGWAPSLDSCVKGFFGMEKDTEHWS